MADDMIIRTATCADWPALWPILRAVAAAGDTFTYPLDLDESTAEMLWMEKPPGRTVVATDRAGAILGTAKITRNQAGPGSHVATASFMVSPSGRGLGVGRALGEAAIDWAQEAGFRAMQFNAVVSTNTAAVHLWRSLGFEVVGVVPGAFAHPVHGDVALNVMHRWL
ncbi:GNAT superfamily N-acetyltransferase [Sphingomonas sp. UYAg733]